MNKIQRTSATLWLMAIVLLIALPQLAPGETPIVHPGLVWQDDRGHEIEAHGGGMLRWKGTYFWFGEDRSQTNDPAKRYVACYASKDLVNWTYRGQVVALDDPEHLGLHWVLERPKVYRNQHTGKFVMYAHLDDAAYKLARVAVLVSDRIDGPYRYVRSFRPLGQESRDIGQFVDDDGSAYLIFEARPTKGFFIAKLSDDYLDIAEQVSFLKAPLEGGAIVHYQGLYYAVGSHMTGWKPNPNVFATSPSLTGPWTEFQNIAPPERNTYGSQSTMLVKIPGSKKTTVLFLGDIWDPKEQWDSRYLWMPVDIGNGKLSLPAPHDFALDVKTGETRPAP